MTDKLLKYYNEELSYLRKEGESFAMAHPSIASRLRLGPGDIEDPFVGRLSESFAFLTARIRHKIDEQSNTISQALLNILYPHYLLPLPPMSIVQLSPQDNLDKAYTIPANTQIASELIQNVPCLFSTRYPVTLWPIKINNVQIKRESPLKPIRNTKNIKSCLRVQLQTFKPELTFNELQPNKLRFYIKLEQQQAFFLYELLFNQTDHIVLSNPDFPGQIVELPKSSIKPVGFSDDEALLPYPAHSFSGYRLLTEYFSCPQKFMFFEICDLAKYTPNNFNDKLDITFFFNQITTDLEQNVSKTSLALDCTPIINLFELTGEPIRLDNKQSEYHIIPDAHREKETLEVYQIKSININTNKHKETIKCLPYFSNKYKTQHDTNSLYWYAHRKPAWEIGAHHMAGSESFVSFNHIDIPYDIDDALVLTPKLLCSNRDLANHLPFGGNKPEWKFWQTNHAAVDHIRCVSGITPAKYRHIDQSNITDLVSHVSLNQISFEHDSQTLEMLKEILALYNYNHHQDSQPHINGLLTMSTKKVVEHHPISLKYGFCCGMEFQLDIDEKYFPNNTAYLFGSVLEQFLAKSCSVNSFSKLTLRSKQRGIIKQWKPRLGIKATC